MLMVQRSALPAWAVLGLELLRVGREALSPAPRHCRLVDEEPVCPPVASAPCPECPTCGSDTAVGTAVGFSAGRQCGWAAS